jgi:K+-sensing histidine kinase KdpD
LLPLIAARPLAEIRVRWIALHSKSSTTLKSAKPDEVTRLRALAHDLSNSLEAILQATYLLNQGKLDAGSKRWAELIDTSSQEAARINREIRKILRALSET